MKQIVTFSNKSRWHLFIVLFVFSAVVESVVALLIDARWYAGMLIGSLLTSAVLAATDKRNLGRKIKQLFAKPKTP